MLSVSNKIYCVIGTKSLKIYLFQYEFVSFRLKKIITYFLPHKCPLTLTPKFLQLWKALLFLETLQEKTNTSELQLCNLLSLLLTPEHSLVAGANGYFYQQKRWCPSTFCGICPINPEHNVSSTHIHDHTGSWACYCSGKCVMNSQMMNYAKAECQRWWNW